MVAFPEDGFAGVSRGAEHDGLKAFGRQDLHGSEGGRPSGVQAGRERSGGGAAEAGFETEAAMRNLMERGGEPENGGGAGEERQEQAAQRGNEPQVGEGKGRRVGGRRIFPDGAERGGQEGPQQPGTSEWREQAGVAGGLKRTGGGAQEGFQYPQDNYRGEHPRGRAVEVEIKARLGDEQRREHGGDERGGAQEGGGEGGSPGEGGGGSQAGVGLQEETRESGQHEQRNQKGGMSTKAWALDQGERVEKRAKPEQAERAEGGAAQNAAEASGGRGGPAEGQGTRPCAPGDKGG